MRTRPWVIAAGFVLVAGLGYWLATTAAPEPRVEAAGPAGPTPVRSAVADDPAPKFRRGARMELPHGDPAAVDAGALEGQRVLIFADAEALARFLERAGGAIRVLGRLDALHALRVGFDDYDDLARLLGDEEESMIYPVSDPAPPDGMVQEGAVGLKNQLHEWLGITGDNSSWGAGVKVAVLDSGVAAHPAFAGSIHQIALVEMPGDAGLINGHGTAVASLIVGGDSLTPGVAPAADLISIRIANDLGYSDSFLLAQGIVAAVDAGADLINISMGSFGDSRLVRNAIEYAAKAGTLIIAATGNNGLDQVIYPAANEGVIAVGGVDAQGNHLAFSNSGTEVDLAAPGYDIFAAWTGGEAVSVSGTSFSAPIITGSIAAIMSEAGPRKLSAARAYDLLVSHLNDGGPAGTDPLLGAGMPDIGRVLERNTPGIHDAAVATSRILPPSPGAPNGQVEVLVQNRGTETLLNTTVRILAGGNTMTSNITTLRPNAVRTVTVPLTRGIRDGVTELQVESSVSLGGGASDRKPANNRRVDTYVASGTR